ncbi:hypothetical protein [Halarchaeum sp. P4]|uniref:hypothetical protein n=1 Tax=Halarchaeum sp. P4 TaxID=3421639 RepID=UPI003EC0B34A
MSDARALDDAVEDALERLFRSGRTNALVAWALVAVLALAFVESLLDVDHLWILFVAATAAVVLVPPLAYRDWRVMLPWELLVLATLPILVRGLFGGTVGTFATSLAVAALALTVTAELHMFTALRVTRWFAVALVVATTLAAAAAWAMARWALDATLGTAYLSTNDALMAEFVHVTLAGVTAGVLFDAYFRRRDRQLRRVIARIVPRVVRR